MLKYIYFFHLFGWPSNYVDTDACIKAIFFILRQKKYSFFILMDDFGVDRIIKRKYTE